MFSSIAIALPIAFLATAGAIPLLRSIARSRESGVATSDRRSGTAGGGVLLGMWITMFYLGSEIGAATDLYVAFLVLAVSGLCLRRSGTERLTPALQLGLELGASAVAGLALAFLMPSDQISWSAPAAVLVGMLLVTPAAISFIGKSESSHAALPAGIVLMELFSIGVLAVVDGQFVQSSAQFMEFLTIAMPATGALMGALIYLVPMPWRARAGIATGATTCLCMGLLVAWGGARTGIAGGAESGWVAALLWALAVPPFELLRSHAARAWRPQRSSDSGAVCEALDIGHSPIFISGAVVLLGGVGLVLWQLGVPGIWSTLALIPGWLAYALAPGLSRRFSKRHFAQTVDASN